MPNDKQVVTKRVIDYLQSESGVDALRSVGGFKVLQKMMHAKTAGLDQAVEEFASHLSEDALAKMAITEDISKLSKSIARSITSHITQVAGMLNYDHEAALDNFNRVDRSKYETKGEYLAPKLSEFITKHAKELNANDKFFAGAVATTLSTMCVAINEAENADVAVALMAGIFAKVAGQHTPFPIRHNMVDLPREVIASIHDASVAISLSKYLQDIDPIQAMKIGKEIGKDLREKLFENRNDLALCTNIIENRGKYEEIKKNKPMAEILAKIGRASIDGKTGKFSLPGRPKDHGRV